MYNRLDVIEEWKKIKYKKRRTNSLGVVEPFPIYF